MYIYLYVDLYYCTKGYNNKLLNIKKWCIIMYVFDTIKWSNTCNPNDPKTHVHTLYMFVSMGCELIQIL